MCLLSRPASSAPELDGVEPIELGDDSDLSALYQTDEFRLYCFKVLPCSKRATHNWQACVFAHWGEKARRRDIRTHAYSSQLCPDVKREGGCPRGDSCHMSHNIFESWLHPELYRTQLCTAGANCTRSVCFFAHSVGELRAPSKSAKQLAAAAAGGRPGLAMQQQQQQLAPASLDSMMMMGAAAAGGQAMRYDGLSPSHVSPTPSSPLSLLLDASGAPAAAPHGMLPGGLVAATGAPASATGSSAGSLVLLPDGRQATVLRAGSPAPGLLLQQHQAAPAGRHALVASSTGLLAGPATTAPLDGLMLLNAPAGHHQAPMPATSMCSSAMLAPAHGGMMAACMPTQFNNAAGLAGASAMQMLQHNQEQQQQQQLQQLLLLQEQQLHYQQSLLLQQQLQQLSFSSALTQPMAAATMAMPAAGTFTMQQLSMLN